MKNTFLKLKDKILGSSVSDSFPDELGEDYLQIDADAKAMQSKQKVLVRPFILKEFADVKMPLEALREGYTIALINVKPLKDKDIIELKRAINKLKKTCEAISGDIAGFGDEWVVATPNFAQIWRAQMAMQQAQQQAQAEQQQKTEY